MAVTSSGNDQYDESQLGGGGRTILSVFNEAILDFPPSIFPFARNTTLTSTFENVFFLRRIGPHLPEPEATTHETR